MKGKRIEDKSRRGCSAKFFCLLMVTLLVNACSMHDQQFSYFNMLDEKKRTSANKQAAEKFWSSVRPASTLVDSHYRLGRHYQQKGEYDKAIKEFTNALQRDLTFCKAHNGIAMSYDALRNCEAAHASYDKALLCAPDQAYVYNNYACSSLLCGDYGKGVTLLLKAEKLADENTRIKNNLRVAQALINNGNISGHVSTTQKMEGSAAESVIGASLPEGGNTLNNTVYTTPENTPQALPPNDLSDSHHPMKIEISTLEVVGKTPEGFSTSPAPNVAVKAKLGADKNKKILAANSDFSSLNLANLAIEIANGNGSVGMAGRSAAYLRRLGFKVRSITNAKTFRVQESKIFYKDGCAEVAKALAATLPGLQNLEKVEVMGKTAIGVRVLLGRDLVGRNFPEDLKGVGGFSWGQAKAFPGKKLIAANSSTNY